MHQRWNVAGAVLLSAWISACEKSYEDKEAALSEFISENNMGNGSDYWLTSPTAFGGPVKVALIFGIDDDAQLCSEIAEAMSKRDRISYGCLPAN